MREAGGQRARVAWVGLQMERERGHGREGGGEVREAGEARGEGRAGERGGRGGVGGRVGVVRVVEAQGKSAGAHVAFWSRGVGGEGVEGIEGRFGGRLLGDGGGGLLRCGGLVGQRVGGGGKGLVFVVFVVGVEATVREVGFGEVFEDAFNSGGEEGVFGTVLRVAGSCSGSLRVLPRPVVILYALV